MIFGPLCSSSPLGNIWCIWSIYDHITGGCYRNLAGRSQATAKHPVSHRTGSTTKNYLVPTVNNFENEKSGTKVMLKYLLKKEGKRTPERMPTMQERLLEKAGVINIDCTNNNSWGKIIKLNYWK